MTRFIIIIAALALVGYVVWTCGVSEAVSSTMSVMEYHNGNLRAALSDSIAMDMGMGR